MANVAIVSKPISDSGTISGGIWQASLPLANLRTQQPQQVARTTNLVTSDTRFTIDFGLDRAVQMFAFVNHNLTASATIRIRLSAGAGGSSPLIDVTIPGLEPNVPFGSQPWGDFPWDGYAAESTPGGAITSYLHTSIKSSRYLLIDIADPSNPAGYIQMGRFMAGLPFIPKYNAGRGASIRFVDPSVKTRSVGGSIWSDVKPKWRTMALNFPATDRIDAMGRMYDLQNNLGTTGELLMVFNTAETEGFKSRRTIYGVMEDLGPIIQDNPSLTAPFTTSLTIEELL